MVVWLTWLKSEGGPIIWSITSSMLPARCLKRFTFSLSWWWSLPSYIRICRKVLKNIRSTEILLESVIEKVVWLWASTGLKGKRLALLLVALRLLGIFKDQSEKVLSLQSIKNWVVAGYPKPVPKKSHYENYLLLNLSKLVLTPNEWRLQFWLLEWTLSLVRVYWLFHVFERWLL